MRNYYFLSKAGTILFPALSIVIGLQLIRVVIPQLVWVLGDHYGLSAVPLGLVALVVFLSAFTTGLLKKIASNRTLTIYTAVGLGLTRVLIQMPWTNTLVTLIIAMAGIILFGLFLAFYSNEMRFQGNMATGNMFTGFMTGIIIDTALYGIFGTYDIVWQTGIVPFGIVILTVILQIGSLFFFDRKKHEKSETRGIAWAWFGLGPFLFLQVVVLQNIARQAVSTGWDLPYAFGLVMLANIAGLFAVIPILRKGIFRPLPVSLVCGIILTAGMAFPFPDNPWVAAVLTFAEQVSAMILVALIISASVSKADGIKKSSIGLSNATGFLLMGLIMFVYYAGYQIKMPFENTLLEPVAAALIMICAVIPSLKARYTAADIRISWAIPALTLVMLALPLAGILTFEKPQAVSGTGSPVKMMTYNLHNGFNPQGDLDMEALAQVIEEANPDVIALQEISRGWLISGRVDMLTWLSQRLDMPYATGPTEGALWGNAVLSRFPITESANYELPPRNLFLRRGILVTTIDIGNGETLNVMATHTHHLIEDSAIRQQQVPPMLEIWDDAPYTVITGDFNAQPDTPEIAMCRNAGLTDVMAWAVPPEGYTFNSVEPYERIDYIWITPDLVPSNAGVIQTQASDHLPIIVELSR